MVDLGPAWLKHELPQPIARAWHLANLEVPPSGLMAAHAVEVALRFVTAIQLASLLAEGASLPRILSDGTFVRPTLGSWIALVRTLRREAQSSFLPELRLWPSPHIEPLLENLVTARNRIAHAKGIASPGDRRAVAAEVTGLAARILTSLDWLRRVDLFVPSDPRPGPGHTIDGYMQIYRATEVQPELQRVSWIGELAPLRCYLAASSNPGVALDVDPFIRRARLPDARTETLCLWGGFGKRAEVLLLDDGSAARAFVPLPDVERRVAWRARMAMSDDDPTRYERPAVEHPTRVAAATVKAQRPPPRLRSTRRWIPVAFAFALLAAGGVALALFAAPTDAPDPAPAEVNAATGATDLAGEWRFDTVVLHSRRAKTYGLGTRGHYELILQPRTDCGFPALLIKTGYTERGALRAQRLVDERCFAVSQSGGSIVVAAKLRHPDLRTSADISFRLTRAGDHLLGLWRHEGVDGADRGYSGALTGMRVGAEPGPRPAVIACFEACIEACHRGADPLDPASEPCLVACVRGCIDS